MKLTADRPCPVCKEPLNAHSVLNSDNATPGKDDLTICAYCTSFLKYGENLSLQKLTQTEMDKMHPVNKQALMEVRKMIRENPVR